MPRPITNKMTDNNTNSNNNRIWVFGGANLDILGHSEFELKEYDSNIGDVAISFGGVGRNIAQVCSLFYDKVNFVTCFSNDYYGKLIQEDCKNLNIDISYSITHDNYPTSVYLALHDTTGDMKYAINDMRILNTLTKEDLNVALKDVKESDIIIIDSNYSPELIEHLENNAICKIASDPVSVAKAKRIKDILHNVSIFKPNQYESETLSGIKIVDDISAKDSIDYYQNLGIEEIIITLAEKGIVFSTKDHAPVWITSRPLDIHSATGGGDTFLGAYVSERIRGSSPMDSVHFAITASAIAIENEYLNRKNITREIILREIDNMNIQERSL